MVRLLCTKFRVIKTLSVISNSIYNIYIYVYWTKRRGKVLDGDGILMKENYFLGIKISRNRKISFCLFNSDIKKQES